MGELSNTNPRPFKGSFEPGESHYQISWKIANAMKCTSYHRLRRSLSQNERQGFPIGRAQTSHANFLKLDMTHTGQTMVCTELPSSSSLWIPHFRMMEAHFP